MLLRTSILAVGLSLISFGVIAEPRSNLNSTPRTLIESPWPGNRLLDTLNLTSEQKEKMAEIRQKYQEQIAQSWQNLRSAQLELMQMMSSDETVEAIRSKHSEIVSLREKVQSLNFERMLEMRAVLNQEQRSLLGQSLLEQRQSPSNQINNCRNATP